MHLLSLKNLDLQLGIEGYIEEEVSTTWDLLLMPTNRTTHNGSDTPVLVEP